MEVLKWKKIEEIKEEYEDRKVHPAAGSHHVRPSMTRERKCRRNVAWDKKRTGEKRSEFKGEERRDAGLVTHWYLGDTPVQTDGKKQGSPSYQGGGNSHHVRSQGGGDPARGPSSAQLFQIGGKGGKTIKKKKIKKALARNRTEEKSERQGQLSGVIGP